MGSQKITYIIFLCIVACNGKNYDNYSLFMGIPNTDEELAFYKTLVVEYNVLYWKKPGKLYSSVEFSVDPNQLEKLLFDTYRNNVSLNVITTDIQSTFDKQKVKRYTTQQLDTFDWTGYYRLNDIYNWYEDLQNAYPDVVRLIKIGVTEEQRSIMAIKLKFQPLVFQPRPKVIIEGGIHAREWISPAFVTYMINELLNAQTTILRDMAEAYDWIFVPVLNPDGYEYTHTTDRLWKKNRRRGHGVDLNRNFDAVFGMVKANHHGYSDSYCGEAELSEAESKAMANLVISNQRDLKYYIAFHSFGQNFIIPYEYSEEHKDNYKEVKEMGDLVAERISRRFDTEYSVGTMYDIKGYVASGTSTSWVKKTFKIPYVATFDLRDTGMNGYALPSKEIIPTCLETMDGVCSFLGYPGCVSNSTVVPGPAIPLTLSKGHCVIPEIFLIVTCYWSLL